MGGKNKPDNSAVVNEQKQEAADEKAKEDARQARIAQGLASIKDAFEGKATTKATPFDWSKFNPQANQSEIQYENAGGNLSQPHAEAYTDPSLPAGYTIRKTAGSPASAVGGAASPSNPFAGFPTSGPQAATTGFGGLPLSKPAATAAPGTLAYETAGWPTSGGAGGAGGAGGYEVVGPDGKVYEQGDTSFMTQTPDGGHTGGFDDAFYGKYKQAVLDYYMPQVDKQYSDAKKQATYGLARSGNLISTAANDLTADLAKQNDVNVAGIRNQADTAAGDLRSQVNTEEQKAVSQLYATEDPEVAANQSLAAVRDISLQQPDLSPLSALFNVATIGGANVLKGYQNQQNLNTFTSSLPSASRSSKVVSSG